MLWAILIAVVVAGLWVLSALNSHAADARRHRAELHTEQMAYLAHLRDLIAAARTEIREASGKPSWGEETAALLRRD